MAGSLSDVVAEVARGADIDEQDDDGRTPLMVACATGAADIVKYLVHEARPPAALEANAVEGWTPLMIACGGGHLE
eukprot:9073-Heterococcus_DN1.PRE.1